MESHEMHQQSFSSDQSKEKFFPKGAMAFFLALVALCLLIWFGIYFLMLDRV